MEAVLISQQGSGTNLLRSFLNSHPDIEFWSELFCPDRNFGLFKAFAGDESEFLNVFYNNKSPKVIGFDLKYNQMNPKVVAYLHKNNVKVIHLIRDPVRTAMRMLNEVNREITYNQMIDYCNMIIKMIKTVRQNFSSHPYLEITYEDMTRGKFNIDELPSRFEEKLLKWLEVKPQKLQVSFNHIRKEKLKMRFL